MKQILAILTVTLLGLSTYLTTQDNSFEKNLFQQWKDLNNKQYSEIEEQYRRIVFQENQNMILAHNSDSQQTYTMAHNQFSDLTKDEFKALYLDYNIAKGLNKKQKSQIVNDSNESYDWRSTTTVRDMKSGCLSSWAFSAIGTVESYFATQQNKKVALSAQQLLDCDKNNQSCNGGVPFIGLSYVAEKGLTLESVYPYISKFAACQIDGGAYKTNDVEEVEDLKAGLRKYAVSVVVDAANWQFYSTGIFNNCKDDINLSVVAVGFTDTYWIVSSVWGTSWGQSGYIYLSPGDTCGVTQMAFRAI